MSDSVLVLGASLHQIPMIEAAKRLDLSVVAVDGNPSSPGFAIADAHEVADVMDHRAVIAAAAAHSVSGVTTMVSNLGMRTVARAARALGLPGIDPEAADLATDKRRIKQILSDRGVPVPDGGTCSGAADARELARRLSYPVIIKPADGTKGRGIRMVESDDGLDDAIANALSYSPGKQLIIERLIDGPTVGAECLIVNGDLVPILLTDKFNTPPPEFVTVGLTTPSNLPGLVAERVKSTAADVAEALGLTMGAAHIDMVVDGDTPTVIDVGPRLASGPVIFDFAPDLMGVDMIESVIRMAVGDTPQVEPRWNGRYAASRFITVDQEGCMYELKTPPSETGFDLYPYLPLGVPVSPPGSDTDRLACITVKGDDYQSTYRLANNLLQEIQVRVVH